MSTQTLLFDPAPYTTPPRAVRIEIEFDPFCDPPWDRDCPDAPGCISRPNRHLTLWGEELPTANMGVVDAALDERKAVVWVPIYAYAHGGVCIRHTPFECQWDSWKAGYAYFTRDQLDHRLRRYPKGQRPTLLRGRITPEQYKWGEARLIEAISTWNKWVAGDVLGYRVIGDDGEEIDSCYGIYEERDELCRDLQTQWSLPADCVTMKW